MNTKAIEFQNHLATCSRCAKRPTELCQTGLTLFLEATHKEPLMQEALDLVWLYSALPRPLTMDENRTLYKECMASSTFHFSDI